MIDRVIKLFGTDESGPEQRRLVAGPGTATIEDGQLPQVRKHRTVARLHERVVVRFHELGGPGHVHRQR